MPNQRICSVEGCGKKYAAKGYCFQHYYAWKTYGDPLVSKKKPPKTICTIEGCGKPEHGRGLCGMHAQRMKKHGDPHNAGPVFPEFCSIPGCNRKHRSLGLCDRHYQAKYKYGDPLTYHGTVRGSLYQYYLDVVLNHDEDACLIWPYAKSGRNGLGYATMTTPDGKKVAVHRAVCEAVNGPPPTPRHEACHTCGNGHLGCVAKKHQKWGTRSGNMADKLLHGTHHRGERNPQARLVEDDIRQIRKLADYLRTPEIAKMFGISREHTRDIISRKRWYWLE